MKIENVPVAPHGPTSTHSLMLDFINVSPCEKIQLQSAKVNLELKYGEHTGYREFSMPNASVTVTGKNCYSMQDSYSTNLILGVVQDNGIYQSVFLDILATDMTTTVLQQKFPSPNRKESKSRLRTIYSSGGRNITSKLSLQYKHHLYEQNSVTLDNLTAYDGSIKLVRSSKYNVKITVDGAPVPITMQNQINMLTFGEYTVTLTRPMHMQHSDELVVHFFEDIGGTAVHRLAQLPQYIVITAGEIMFSVTGLEFSYSQVRLLRLFLE